MTSSSDPRARCLATLLTATLLSGCGSDGIATPKPAATLCDGVAVNVRRLEPLEHVVVSGADLQCIALAGEGREYLVVPQLTGATLPYGGYGYRVGDPATITARLTRVSGEPDAMPKLASADQVADAPDAQALLDARMRAREASTPVPVHTRHGGVALQTLRAGIGAADSLRSFSVLNTLDATPAYSTVQARLRFTGTRVLLYVDTLAQAQFTDGEVSAMGALYDQRLLPAVTAAFGDGSDLDANGRIIFLLTPTVNAIVPAAQCGASGFVRGFFYSHDLSSTATTSNRGEIFYGYVPDETGRWSCPHGRAEVLSNLAPTFVHELQHMLSFGEHAVLRGGQTEEVWLNEGLSHLAEEIGSLSYEKRFPAPSGRTVASQIFPDSAAPYITPNLTYSYRYLFSSGVYSVTSCAPGSFCSLAERGGTWLFLRWLADQQPESFLRQVVQTNRTGRANLEAVLQRSTASLLGEFAIAVSTDSIIGASRNGTPSALRFRSRNLRSVYKALFDAVGLPGGISRPFPFEPIPLEPGASVSGTMRPGTFMTYRFRIPAGTASSVLRMVAVDGVAFPASSGAQVSIVRMP
ncbi:MAG TPA: hypothetical protein VE861_15860 [Gemmatimonadaceae bacterium]|nr:hypothetical protein [Gemmatimonadaceae bacterium]